MIRKDIIIDTYHYIVDLYKIEDLEENHKSKFVMIRNFDIKGNVMYDHDLYFIEKSVLEEVLNSDSLNNTTDIIYPLTNKNYIGFSTEFKDFNNNFQKENFYITNIDEQSSMIYNLYDSADFSEAEIPCDKIKIYHPHIKTKLDSILYVDTYISGIHVHLFCKLLNQLQNNSETEFIISHNFYSEYYSCYIPNIETLLSEKIFYKENLNKIEVYNQSESELIHIDENNNIYGALKLFRLPYYIENNNKEEYYYKVYKPNEDPIVNNNGFLINIGLYPFSELNSDNQYIMDSTLIANKNQYFSDCRFTISSKLGFANDIISVINTFNFPNKNNYSSFTEAYQKINKVNLKDYTGIVDDEAEDYDPENPVEQKQCGFIFELFSDLNCKQRIAKQIVELENPETELDNFAFNINGIFNSWNQYPEIIIGRCKFVDRYLGRILIGNLVPITKEWFKYIINNDTKSRLSFTGTQEKITELSNMDLSKFNFINNINCTVVKNSTDNQQIQIKSSGAKVIYRPIFFKTAELQHTSIINGLNQNVGINLSEYMTKVNTFKMVIDGQTFVEYGRNDIFVIFNIDANKINTTTGSYHILNQDDEYISSGTYTIS